MSVTSVLPLYAECSEDQDGNVTYSANWQVLTNARTDGAQTVLNGSGLPRRGDTYSFSGESDAFAWCRSRKARLTSVKDTAKQWTVTLDYSSKGSDSNPQNGSGGGGNSNPIDFDWKVKLSTWSRMEAPDADFDNRALVNAANEPFLPPPEFEQIDPVVVLERNTLTFDLAEWAAAVGKVNSSAMWGLAARYTKLRDWTATQHWTGPGQMYFANTLTVEIKDGGYYYQPPNMGHREFQFDAAGNKIIRAILDDRGVPVARPVPLDQFGFAKGAGLAPDFFDQVAGNLQRFKIGDEYDLTPILPASLPGNFV